MFIEEREIWALKKSCKRDSYKSKSKKACIQTCMVNLPKRNFFLTSSFSPAKSRDIRTIINQLQIIWNTNWFLPPKLWLHVWFIYIKNRQLNSLLFLHILSLRLKKCLSVSSRGEDPNSVRSGCFGRIRFIFSPKLFLHALGKPQKMFLLVARPLRGSGGFDKSLKVDTAQPRTTDKDTLKTHPLIS